MRKRFSVADDEDHSADGDMDSFRLYAPVKEFYKEEYGQVNLIVYAPSGWTWRRGRRGTPARAPTRKSVGVN